MRSRVTLLTFLLLPQPPTSTTRQGHGVSSSSWTGSASSSCKERRDKKPRPECQPTVWFRIWPGRSSGPRAGPREAQRRLGCCWRGPVLSGRRGAPPRARSTSPSWRGCRCPSSVATGPGTLVGAGSPPGRCRRRWRSRHRARIEHPLLQKTKKTFTMQTRRMSLPIGKLPPPPKKIL